MAHARHKIFLGMAPGVGKTYQMLEEGQEEKRRGRDVVIGYLEPHGREDTLAQARGLEFVPRQRLEYRGVTLEELDLDAILHRRPELCLIDELAHTNVPGAGNEKRHQDVAAVLEAGIDVYSTVNVQHVESLTGQIGRLVGTPVRETLPDHVLDGADDVVLVDVTPELLIERLRAGKIYEDQSAEIAQQGFFHRDRLATLREIALLAVAEEVEPSRRAPARRRRAPIALERTAPVPDVQRVLALVAPDPRTRPTVYHAFRTAERLHAAFDALWVCREPEHAADGDPGVQALERLVTTLGGTLLIRTGRNLAATAAEVARERGTTYLVIGRPRTRAPFKTFAHRRLPYQLMSALPEVDVQIVALPDVSKRTLT